MGRMGVHPSLQPHQRAGSIVGCFVRSKGVRFPPPHSCRAFYFPEPCAEVFSQPCPRGYQKADQPDQTPGSFPSVSSETSLKKNKNPPKTNQNPPKTTALLSLSPSSSLVGKSGNGALGGFVPIPPRRCSQTQLTPSGVQHRALDDGQPQGAGVSENKCYIDSKQAPSVIANHDNDALLNETLFFQPGSGRSGGSKGKLG